MLCEGQFYGVDNDFYQKIAIAVVGGVIGAVLSNLFGLLRSSYDETRRLKRIKQLVFADLNKKREIVDELIEEYEALRKKFVNRDLQSFHMKLFHNLNADIFNTVSKSDLVYLFGREDCYKLDDIYTYLAYVKKYDIEFTYEKYLTWEKQHKEEHKNDPKHEYWCVTHIETVKRTIENIDNHLVAARAAKTTIGITLRKYKYE